MITLPLYALVHAKEPSSTIHDSVIVCVCETPACCEAVPADSGDGRDGEAEQLGVHWEEERVEEVGIGDRALKVEACVFKGQENETESLAHVGALLPLTIAEKFAALFNLTSSDERSAGASLYVLVVTTRDVVSPPGLDIVKCLQVSLQEEVREAVVWSLTSRECEDEEARGVGRGGQVHDGRFFTLAG
jgi:hypothetical protein